MLRADRVGRLAVAVVLLACGFPAVGYGGQGDQGDADGARPAEAEVVPPAFPKDADLVEFYVGPMATNHFFVDSVTLNPGTDGIVRYVLVVRTAGGATNVSFEGIRCSSDEYRIYAVGTADGKWLKARGDEWRPTRGERVNPYRAAVAHDLFCPDGIAIRSADEGRKALRRGGRGSTPSP